MSAAGRFCCISHWRLLTNDQLGAPAQIAAIIKISTRRSRANATGPQSVNHCEEWYKSPAQHWQNCDSSGFNLSSAPGSSLPKPDLISRTKLSVSTYVIEIPL